MFRCVRKETFLVRCVVGTGCEAIQQISAVFEMIVFNGHGQVFPASQIEPVSSSFDIILSST